MWQSYRHVGVAEAVVRRAPCPVLVYRESPEKLIHDRPLGTGE